MQITGNEQLGTLFIEHGFETPLSLIIRDLHENTSQKSGAGGISCV